MPLAQPTNRVYHLPVHGLEMAMRILPILIIVLTACSPRGDHVSDIADTSSAQDVAGDATRQPGFTYTIYTHAVLVTLNS